MVQFVCEIITAVKWEKEFRCEGIENLADFQTVIEELSTEKTAFDQAPR